MPGRPPRSLARRVAYDLVSCFPAVFRRAKERRKSDHIRGWVFFAVTVLLAITAVAKCGTATSEAYLAYKKGAP